MVAVLIATAMAPRGALAQGSIIDRAKKSMTDAASATQKGLSDEVSRQANAAIDAAASAEVADGAFNAAVSPWVGNDGAKRVELARYSGDAFAITTATGREIVLCDDRGLLPWLASLQIDNNASGGRASATGRSGGRGATGQATTGVAQGGSTRASTPTAASAPAKPGATSETNGDVASASKNGSTLPNAAAREYRLPSSGIVVTLPTSASANAGAPSLGSLKVGDISGSIFSGVAKVRFAQATLPGSAKKEIVDFGVVFKARVLAEGATPPQCLAGASKGGSASGTANAATSVKGGQAAAVAAVPNSNSSTSSATSSSAVPSFAEGDMLTPRIANVKLLSDAKDDATVVATLEKGAELVYLGQEQNGYSHVQSASGEGWVRKVLLSKK